MKRLFALVALFMAFCLGSDSLQAQDYDVSLGVRMGGGTGITYKKRSAGNFAAEGILYVNTINANGVVGVGLAEWHFPMGRSDWNWFAGFGGHVSLFGDSGFGLGVDGIIGLEYTFRDIPLTFQVDYLPSINFTQSGSNVTNFAVSFRYTF